MKKLLAAAVLLALSATMTAQAEDVILVEGDVLVGHPLTLTLGGVSGTFAGCAAGVEQADGIDGLVFAVPESALDRPAQLTVTGDAAIDFDVAWYDAACAYIDADDDWATEEVNESGVVPPGAVTGAVNGWLGAAAHVKLTYDRA